MPRSTEQQLSGSLHAVTMTRVTRRAERLERGRFGAPRSGMVCWLALLMFPFIVLAWRSTAAESGADESVAEVNGEAITAQALHDALGARLSQLEQQIYDLKRRELEALVADRLFAQEAARRGVSVAALLDAEVTTKVGLVTEQEIDVFYEANKGRVRSDPITARSQIRAYLQQQKLSSRRDAFVQSLRSQGNVVVRLQPPPVLRVNVSTEGAIVRGSADAPVALVEFSDFQCPFCKQSQATLKQLLERYAGKVKLVYRDFPLDQLHPQARPAAEAARCAHDQGKFWEYHDMLFANAVQLTSESLRRYAEQVGLDMKSFERCVSTRVHQDVVQRDVDEAKHVGISGTPAFFINGRPLTGAQPLETFVRVIEEELARKDDTRTEKR